MELASQECCLHRILFTHRYVTFVLVIITFVFTLYSVRKKSNSDDNLQIDFRAT